MTTGIRIHTSAGWPDIPHIEGRNFKPLIDSAKELPGFQENHMEGKVMVDIFMIRSSFCHDAAHDFYRLA
jgi:hydroxylamine reductase (hybrid-cluster protein)